MPAVYRGAGGAMQAHGWRIGIVLAAALVGCVTDTELEAALDRDRDGYLPIEAGGDDCDETRSSVNPGADEICGDGIDNDCDGVPDDDGLGSRVFFVDADGDGFGADGAESVTACQRPEGYAAFEGDCADDDPSRNPNAEDLCDGIDQNCDGQPDDDDLLVARYPDADGDGIGVQEGVVFACEELEGYVGQFGDCDDSDETVSPNAEDACNGQDDNCNGLVDEDAVNRLRYRDADGDQWGTESDTVEACLDAPGYVDAPGDCDDGDPATNPAALDTCDGIDRDCNGVPDDDALEQTWYEDADGDGFGDDGVAVGSCAPIAGFSLTPGDCDDADAGVSPAILDGCDGQDQNCNGILDEDAPLTLFYEDADGDGSGVEAVSVEACAAPSGYVQVFGDCDDGDASIRPGSLDPCDGIDQDCDGAVDETASFTVWYEDADGDGLGDGLVAVSTCDGAPSGYVGQSGDCDDTNPLVTVPQWYADGDGDGYGTDAMTASACVQPSGFAALSDDCDDGDALANPGRVEVCNNFRDDDCDSDTDCRLTGTFTSTDADLSFDLPTAPSDLRILPISDVTGGAASDWVVEESGSWTLYPGPTPSFGAGGTALDCTEAPRNVPDVTGDGRWDMACSAGTDFVVYSSGTLAEWIRVQASGMTAELGFPIASSGMGDGVWVGVGQELRFYGRPSAVADDSDILHTVDCPAGDASIGGFTLPGEGGVDYLVALCEDALEDARDDAYVLADEGFLVDDIGEAVFAIDAPASLRAVSLLPGVDAIERFLVLTIEPDPQSVQISTELFLAPLSEPIVASSAYLPAPGSINLAAGFGDFDRDGRVDWIFSQDPEDAPRVDLAYGTEADPDLADGALIVLPTFGGRLGISDPAYRCDTNADGFPDLPLVEQLEDGSRTMRVFFGVGQ